MSRTIKFRAYSKILNSIMEPWIPRFDKKTKELVVEGTDIIVMQYTGLKDKNGVEIYEGDIISTGGGQYREHWEVKYYADQDYPAFDIEGWDSEENGLSYQAANGDHAVIGNIYENKDLLK